MLPDMADMLDTYTLTTADWEQYVSLLHSFSAMGAAMRHVIAKAVTNPHVYSNLTQGTCHMTRVPRAGGHSCCDYCFCCKMFINFI